MERGGLLGGKGAGEAGDEGLGRQQGTERGWVTRDWARAARDWDGSGWRRRMGSSDGQ